MFIRFNKFTITWLLFTLILTTVSGVKDANIDSNFTDKMVHMVLFSVLNFLMTVGLSKQSDYIRLKYLAERVSIITCLVWGIILEVLQLLLPSRSFSWHDVLFNCIGTFIGWLMFLIIYKINIK